MAWEKEAKRWEQYDQLEENIREELTLLQNQPVLMEDSFYKTLEFGTGGMRGEIGPGTNRMNIYTIRKAAKGLADYVIAQGHGAAEAGVVISYDNRRMSKAFALEAACTLGACGVKSYVFKKLRPTPVLSFAVRELNTAAGVMITASHNPPEYNGFKAYGDDGAQMIPEDADRLISMVDAVEDELTVETAEAAKLEAEGLLHWVLEDIDDAYAKQLQKVITDRSLIKEYGASMPIVFTPLHGTAKDPMERGLREAGFEQVFTVPEQAEEDSEFPTVASPNPEEPAAFELAMELGREKDADLLIATDPDADRIGLVVKDNHGSYTVLSGNQTGALLLHYLLMKKKEAGILPDNGISIKTIVTSELGRTIAESFGITSMDVLTGFKFIGEKIRQFEEDGSHTFLFGYEESYGYLIEPFARDKDAIQPGLLAAEMAAYYRSRGQTLYEGLLELYDTYGWYYEDLASYTFKGKEGAEKIQRMMNVFRDNVLQGELPGDVAFVEDYQRRTRTFMDGRADEAIALPPSNVLKMFLRDGSWYCLRPSGTEPKIKIYFGVQDQTADKAAEKLKLVKEQVIERVNQL
ncbi:phospho-sugar mutase [Alkalicoccus chagannorensis]|uniref:phospho-sugar mutase n=1 Tax=Alkalicoccus chagannorensis TaxID=427072 RepID=UPI00040EA6CB|nr:phospho-sugar mutase [Alkalicoccus chagannorensis]